MKNWIQLARITVTLLAGCFGLAWLTGCESLQDTSFAPLDARLEPIPGGGAQHFVVVNTSRSEEHTSELQSPCNLVCRLLLEKKKTHRHYDLSAGYTSPSLTSAYKAQDR